MKDKEIRRVGRARVVFRGEPARERRLSARQMLLAGALVAFACLVAACGGGTPSGSPSSASSGATSPHSIWVGAAPGQLLVSNDGGATWAWQQGAPVYLTSLVRTGESEAWGTYSENGHGVCWTTDGGRTWQKKKWRGTSVYGVRSLGKGKMWACGGQGDPYRSGSGVVLTSDDAGRTWRRRVPRGQTMFLQGVELPGRLALVVNGYSGRVSRGPLGSSEGWSYSKSLASRIIARQIAMADARIGWVVGRKAPGAGGSMQDDGREGRIFVTRDGGITWRRQASGLRLPAVAGVFSTDARHAWAVGDEGLLLATRDGGTSWQRLDTKTTQDLAAVVFADQKTGWIVAREAAVLRTADGGLTWTSAEWDPKKVRLSGAIAILSE